VVNLINNEKQSKSKGGDMRKHIRCGSTSMAAMALVLGSAAHAQASGTESDEVEEVSARQGVAEIIVTAQRRQERQLEVPISMTAVTGELLQSTNVFSVTQLGQLVPSFQYEDSLASTGARARIRGIGSPTFVSGVETSVSVIIDGVVTGPSGSGLASLFDVEMVEVLRGPQGTLFGKNATAGVVNITSAKPTRDFSAGMSVQSSVGDFGPVNSPWNVRGDAFVSGPVSDTTAIRVAAFADVDLKGAVEDRFRGGSTYERRHYGGRFTLVH
jgi:iron complex outermembrane recepter protein